MRFILPLMLFGVTCCYANAESNLQTEQAIKLMQRLEMQISSSIHEIMALEHAAGADLNAVRFILDQPANQHTSLGIIVDSSNPTQGLTIIAVSPGSAASKSGLRLGDQVLAIDQQLITDENYLEAVELLHQLGGKESVLLKLKRAEQVFEINAELTSNYFPGFHLVVGPSKTVNTSVSSKPHERHLVTCGTVSTLLEPPRANRYYRTFLRKINGHNVTPINNDSFGASIDRFTLEAGKTYQLTFAENIPVSRETFRRGPRGPRVKTIELFVEANKLYHMGARFNPGKRYDFSDSGYWDAIVWKEATDDCDPRRIKTLPKSSN